MLEHKPVVVLSNNDGCAVSRTDEAKKLGIPMGAPYFQIKELAKKHQVQVLSSNYTLYGDMSQRVMQILSEFTPDLEIYSIDEAFLSFTGIANNNLLDHAKEVRSTVLQYTGIPTCIGIAPTKVLAKAANHIAKKDKLATAGVFSLLDPDKIDFHLKNFPIENIWGIGRQSAQKLYSHKIRTAHDLKISNTEFIRKLLSIVGVRLVEELRGNPCLDLNTDIEDRKQIISSRSFGKKVKALEEIKEAVANHISSAAERLRSQNLICKNLTVFIHTNPFNNTPQYYKSASIDLLSGTAITSKLIKNAFQLLESIYKRNYEYKKTGVILSNLVKNDFIQIDFFGDHDNPRSELFMKVIDQINNLHGRNTVKFAACGINQYWKMLSQLKSPNYTTRWSELLQVD